MTLPSSPLLRWPIIAGFWTLAALAVVSLAGGPDPLGDAYGPIFAVLLLAWFVPELRREQAPGLRRLLWIGIGAAVLMLVGAALNLLF